MLCQVYGWNEKDRTVFAAPIECRRVCQKTANRIYRKWAKWRAEYVASNPGLYPLRFVGSPSHIGFQGMGKNPSVTWYGVKR